MAQKRLLAAAVAASLTLCPSWANAQPSATRIAIDDDDIAGTVSSIDGPESGSSPRRPTCRPAFARSS